jgi:hypothetical protein
MNGSEIKTFVTNGLGAGDIGDIEFYIMLNVMKTCLEEERDWKVLEVTDSSQTVSTGDTFLTLKNLPADFAQDIGLFLTNSNNQPVNYHPIPFRERYQRKDEPNGYWVDVASGKFGLTGKASSGFTTVNLVYRKTSTEITSSSSWVFPARFHPILGYMVAVAFKGGVDYDSISAKQAVQNREDSKMLYESLIDWNTQLDFKSQGNSYEGSGGYDSDGFPSVGEKEFPLSMM